MQPEVLQDFYTGDTFEIVLEGVINGDTNQYIDWIALGVKCEVELWDADGCRLFLLSSPTDVVQPQAGFVLVSYTGSTANWPLGTATLTVRMIDPANSFTATIKQAQFSIRKGISA